MSTYPILGTIPIGAKNILIVVDAAVCCPNIFLQDFGIHFPSSWVYWLPLIFR